MTSSPAPDLDELERLRLAATSTPWELVDTSEMESFEGDVVSTGWVRNEGNVDVGDYNTLSLADATFVATLVNAAPGLLTELRAARAAVAESGRLREALREKVEALPQWWRFDDDLMVSRAAVLALLGGNGPAEEKARLEETFPASPPAPSDHGASGERE